MRRHDDGNDEICKVSIYTSLWMDRRNASLLQLHIVFFISILLQLIVGGFGTRHATRHVLIIKRLMVAIIQPRAQRVNSTCV